MIAIKDTCSNVITELSNVEKCIQLIKQEYDKDSISMVDVLYSYKLYGFRPDEVLYLYARCMEYADGDKLVRKINTGDDKFDEQEI